MSKKGGTLPYEYDTEPKPLNETADCPGVYVCVETGHYFREKRGATSFGVERGYIEQNSGGTPRDEPVWMKRPAPPHSGWCDPYVEEANPELEGKGFIPGNGQESRRIKVGRRTAGGGMQ